MNPQFSWSIAGLLRSLIDWLADHRLVTFTMLVCVILIVAMFVTVSRMDNNRNRRL